MPGEDGSALPDEGGSLPAHLHARFRERGVRQQHLGKAGREGQPAVYPQRTEEIITVECTPYAAPPRVRKADIRRYA